MKISSAPYFADWLAISLRWTFVVGWMLVRSADLFGPQEWPMGGVLAWNLAMVALAVLNARLPYHRYLNVAADLLLAGTVFWRSGGISGYSPGIALLPILTGAVYFELVGAVMAAAAMAAMSVAGEWTRLTTQPAVAGAWFGALAVAGGAVGSGMTVVVRLLRARRQRGVAAEETRHKAENDRLRAIYDLTSAMTSSLSTQRVLDAALDLGSSALDPSLGPDSPNPLVGVVLLFQGGKLGVSAHRGFTGADSRIVFPAEAGILKKMFDEGEGVHSPDVAADPELGRAIALRSCKSVYCCPLRTGYNVYGALLFAHPLRDYFTPVRRDLLDIISRQSAIAIQNARLYQDLVEEKERLVEVHEEARKKLARDLHDGPTQSVAAMAMRISMVHRLLESDPGRASTELAKISDLADRAGKEIRHTLFTLRPLVLESRGLIAAVNSIAEKMRDTFEQTVHVEMDESLAEQLEPARQSLVFYIIEEAMTNARKHAKAHSIWVRLHSHGPSIALLEIADDGSGFDVGSIDEIYDRRSSLGLVNLRERTELVDGVLEIRSVIGEGTKIQILLPLSRGATERLHPVAAGEDAGRQDGQR